jgi:hypothetical protein
MYWPTGRKTPLPGPLTQTVVENMVWPKSLRPQPAVSEKQSAPTKSPRHIRRPLKLGDLDSKLLGKRNLPVIGDGVSFPSPVVSIARRTSNTFNVVRQGLVGVKGNSAFASLFWQNKWLILTDMTLTLYKSEVCRFYLLFLCCTICLYFSSTFIGRIGHNTGG